MPHATGTEENDMCDTALTQLSVNRVPRAVTALHRRRRWWRR